MKAKTKFLKMFYKMPELWRRELVMGYPACPMTLNVVALEVKNETDMSERLLKELGFEND